MVKGRGRLRLQLRALVIAAGLATILASGRALADAHSDANYADQTHQYHTELRILLPEATRGQAWAQNNLGNLYLNGNGVEQDDDQARIWFEKAAAQNDPGGEINLGQLYQNGYGVSAVDRARAAHLYRKAGEQGRAGGWAMLKRLCDRHSDAAPADCGAIPKGTQSAPRWNIDGRVIFDLIRLAISLVLLGLLVAGWIARWKKRKADRIAAAGQSPVVGSDQTPYPQIGATPADSAALYTRFILVGSTIVTVLIVAPILTLTLNNPKAVVFSPAMIAWLIGVVGIFAILVVRRAKRLRPQTPKT